MALTADTFARVTGGGFPLAAYDGDDRRRQARVSFGQRGQVRLGGERDWATVLVRDLSLDGVGLQTDAPLDAGRPLVLRLTGPGGAAAEVACVVVWCEPGGFLHAGFHVGATFVEPPPAQGPGPTRPAWMADLLVDLSLQRASRGRP